MHGQPAAFEPPASTAERHRGDPLHLGHDRTSEGRGADAREHAAQRGDLARHVPPGCTAGSRAGRRARHAAALPLDGADVSDERRASTAGSVSCSCRDSIRRQVLKTIIARAGRILDRRADDVLVAAASMLRLPARTRRRSHSTCASASRAARRCRSRFCVASRRRSASVCSRATGSPRLLAVVCLQPAAAADASPARSAFRFSASTCGAWTTRAGRCRSANVARSLSADRT